jgi:adenylyltransferase/sulfurtransferase
MKSRYSRHIILPEFGEEGQARLTKSSVLVIGAGGLGAPVLLYLAAAGVGRIGIVEGDAVDESNLQRQILYRTHHTGSAKAEVAFNELVALNPEISIQVFPDYLTKENALNIMAEFDLIVDGSDNFATRYLVNDACVMLNKPFVYGAIYKFDGQVCVFNYQGGPTYRCLFPMPPDPATVPNCSEIGVLGVLPGVIGTLQATEAIKILAGIGEVLSGTLLTYDALSMSFMKIKIPTIELNKNIQHLGNYDFTCDVLPLVSLSELETWKQHHVNFIWLDVREAHEYEADNIGAMNAPLSSMKNNKVDLPFDKEIVVHCQSGIRSKQAVEILISRGYKNVHAFTGSFLELKSSLETSDQ